MTASKPRDLPEWTRQAIPLESVIIEIGFLVGDGLYDGPAECLPDQWDTMREPFCFPAAEVYIPAQGTARFLLTGTVEKSLEELIKYYADVLRLAERYGRRPIQTRSAFHLIPLIASPGTFETLFWTDDTWDYVINLFKQLESSEEGILVDRFDDGLQIDVVASGGTLFIRTAKPGREEVEFACVSCDRASLVSQIPPLRQRTERILTELRARFGTDYWSST